MDRGEGVGIGVEDRQVDGLYRQLDSLASRYGATSQELLEVEQSLGSVEFEAEVDVLLSRLHAHEQEGRQ